MIQAALVVLFTLLWAGSAEAGPVIPAIVAGAQAFAATTMGAALIQTAVGMGLSALARAVIGTPKAVEVGIAIEQTTEGESTPQRFIFGRMATNGHLNCPPYVYETDGNPGEWLVYVIELMDGRITGVGDMFVEGERASFLTSPLDPAGNGLGATVSGKYENKVFVRIHTGGQTTPDAYLRNVVGNHSERPWTADMILKGVSYAVVTIKGRANDKVFNGGLPAVRFEIDGLKLYDPRDGQTKFTHNPMVMAWNICRGLALPNGDKWGYNVDPADIVSGPAIVAMNACDAAVTLPDGTTEARYRAALEFSVDEEPSDVLQSLLDACNGDFGDMGGELVLNAGPPRPAVYFFTDKDILITREEDFNPFPGLDSTYNAVHATYPDPESDWEVKDAVPLYNLPWEVQDGGRRLVADIRLRAVPYKRQVRRLMRETAADHRRMRNHQVVLPPDAGHLRLFDTVAWSSVRNRYSNKLFEIRKKDVDPTSGCVILQIRERDPSDYINDPNRDNVFPVVGPSGPSILPPVDGVAGWDAYAVNVDGKPGIRIIWLSDMEADALAWVIRRADSGIEVNSGSTSEIENGRVTLTAGLTRLTDYYVRARAILHRQSLWTQEILVRTLDVGLSWDALDRAVVEDFNRQQQWLEDTGPWFREVMDTIDALRDAQAEADYGGFTHREILTQRVRSETQTAIGTIYAQVQQDIIAATGPNSALAAAITAVEASIPGAVATATSGLVSRVENTERGLQAQSDRVDVVQARTNRGTAEGMLRVSAQSGPSGVSSRIGLHAEVTGTSADSSASMFLEALDDGIGRVVFAANRFFVMNSNAATGERYAPFIIDGGIVYIDTARIKNATIAGAKIIDADITYLKIRGQTLYVPRFWERADVTLQAGSSSTSPVMLFDRNIPDFDGGGYLLSFEASVNTRVDYDQYARVQILVDDVVIKSQSVGLRTSGANTGGEFPLTMTASFYGSGTTNVKVRAWAHDHNGYGGGNSKVVLQNMSLSIAGARR